MGEVQGARRYGLGSMGGDQIAREESVLYSAARDCNKGIMAASRARNRAHHNTEGYIVFIPF